MRTLLIGLLLLGVVWSTCSISSVTGVSNCDNSSMSISNVTWAEDLVTSETKSPIMTFQVWLGYNQTNKPQPAVVVTPPAPQPIVAATKPIPVVVLPIIKTAQECVWARVKDWKTYCGIMWGEGWQIDCDNVDVTTKNQILDRIAAGKQSNQARCLTGEILK